ncbi:MAG TPA: sialate O-acetylesterase, partial [Rhodothermales bacterium]|nr:sialate O-acetylesterase [Rhodothermales bacterium]
GKAEPGLTIRISASWQSEIVETTTTAHGVWNLRLTTPRAGGPFSLRITDGHQTIHLQEVFIGEVWLCSGQSNMEWSANMGILNGRLEIEAAHHPQIHFFNVTRHASEIPLDHLKGRWQACTPASMQNFSAVAYFFARRLQEVLNVPIGLIQAAWGGTPAEVWIPENALMADAFLREAAKKQMPRLWGPHEPGRTYNAMIQPLWPYKIAGVLYYQGESNVENAYAYEALLETLIRSWRTEWAEQLPFYIAQIAPYDYEIPEAGVVVREAQRRVVSKLAASGLVVTSDIGNVQDIHPMNKQDVGLRFANLVLNSHYQQEMGLTSSPIFRKAVQKGEQTIVYFENALGLRTSDGAPPSHFELAGPSGEFLSVLAKIVQDTVILTSPELTTPTQIRFAWHNTATPNLVNGAGLPASCFKGEVENFVDKADA